HVRVYLAIIIFPGYAFASSCKPDIGAIETTVIVFQGSAISAGWFGFTIFTGNSAIQGMNAKTITIGWHMHTAAQLNMIPAGKIQFFIVEPPWDVNVHPAYAI